MKGKKFTSNQTGDLVTIIDIYDNIAILDNGDRVSTRRLLDTNFYDSVIDPSEFLSSGLDIIQREISSIPQSQLENLPRERDIDFSLEDTSFRSNLMEDSAIVITDIETEKRELLNRAIKNSSQSNHTPPRTTLSELLDDYPDQDEIQTQSSVKSLSSHPPTPPAPSARDLMFSGVKKIHPIKLSIEVESLIPKPDFIKMMEESYEHSIIEYLSDEISQKIFEDPSIIKNAIKDQIRKSLSENQVPSAFQEVKKPTPRKKTTTK